MSDAPLIRNVSDTALWMAMYRALESERPDALFHDPYARELAGERGREIVERLPKARRLAWPMVVRTQILDELIQDSVEQDGFDTVLNLACGLDTRPHRLALPARLRWVEADLPEIIEYKSMRLKDARVFCRLERHSVDLTDADQRRALFAHVGAAANRVLIVTEGLLAYFGEEQVKTLAADMRQAASFRRWLTDLMSPRALKMAQRHFAKQAPTAGRLPIQFGPKQHVEFFRPLGWTPLAFHSFWDEGRRLRRSLRGAALINVLMTLIPGARAQGCKMGGIAVLERQ
ncbi:MAG: class I SAM-dependent methyltransferase [Gammaproteobacteria bacterium]|nr:class I SAM-dependent methyltransferase [Gammaproteobacteria bacterium]MDE2024059.1 class I SAM-dependent methyltransferase [Gammaproteobacteria bacterium]